MLSNETACHSTAFVRTFGIGIGIAIGFFATRLDPDSDIESDDLDRSVGGEGLFGMYARLIGENVADRAEGPLLFLRRTLDVGLNEAVEVETDDGRVRLGRVAALDEQTVTLEVLDDTAGLVLEGTRVRFFGEPLQFRVGPGLLGRVFNGVGQPLDGGPPVAADRNLRVEYRRVIV